MSSYYVTRQFGRAIDKLREELGAAFQQQVEAIRESVKATRENKQDPLPIPLRVQAKTETEEAEQTEQREQYRKSHRVQVCLAIATTLAFIAAAYYAAVARSQLDEMRTASEANVKTLIETRIAIESAQDQFDRTIQQMIPQTVASQVAANAAKESANTAVSALKDVQRALFCWGQ